MNFITYIIGHVLLGGCKLFVVRSTASLVDQASRDTAYQQTVFYSELYDCIQARASFLQEHVQLWTEGETWQRVVLNI